MMAADETRGLLEPSQTSNEVTEVPSVWPSALLQFWLDQTFRGVGQVIFLNSVSSGGVLLVSLALGDLYLAFLALIGTVAATVTAYYVLKLPETPGLWGYNGCLVGCATAVFVAKSLDGVVSTIFVAASSTVVAALLPKLCGTMPQWTYAFNIVVLTQLLVLQLIMIHNEDENDADATTTTTTTANAEAPFSGRFLYQIGIEAVLKGLSQIFVVESTLTGAGIAVGVALYSPQLAIYTTVASLLGTLAGLGSGAPVADVTAGLWGYNPALTALGVGVFFRNQPATPALAAGGALVTAAVFAVLQNWCGKLLVLGIPCLTLPFCLAMTGVYHAGYRVLGVEWATEPHSPERNT